MHWFLSSDAKRNRISVHSFKKCACHQALVMNIGHGEEKISMKNTRKSEDTRDASQVLMFY